MSDNFLNNWRETLVLPVGGYGTGDTILEVSDGSRLSGELPMNFLIWDLAYVNPWNALDNSRAEYVRGTSISTNDLTVSRAQEDTGTPIAFTDDTTWVIMRTITEKDMNDKASLSAITLWTPAFRKSGSSTFTYSVQDGWSRIIPLQGQNFVWARFRLAISTGNGDSAGQAFFIEDLPEPVDTGVADRTNLQYIHSRGGPATVLQFENHLYASTSAITSNRIRIQGDTDPAENNIGSTTFFEGILIYPTTS